jgi:ribosomal protein L20A (L18A)
MNLYEDIIEHLLNLILSKENLENYKIQIKKIKDMIKNNNN